MKALKVIIIGGAAFVGGRYLLSLNRLSKKVVVQVSGRVHKVSIDGVEILLKYNIKNPTNSSISMNAPLITLSYNGSVLASSSMASNNIPENVRGNNGTIKILANQETGEISTSILLPTLSLISAGTNLLKILKDRLKASAETKKVKIEVQTTSTVITKLGKYPYDDKTIIDV